MARNSVVMLTDQGVLNFEGDSIRGDGYYGFSDGLHTVQISLNNFIENMEAGLYDGKYEDVVIVYKVFTSSKPLNKFSKSDIQKALDQKIYLQGYPLHKLFHEVYFAIWEVVYCPYKVKRLTGWLLADCFFSNMFQQ